MIPSASKIGRLAALAVLAISPSVVGSRDLYAQDPAADTATILREAPRRWLEYREAVLKSGFRIQVVEHKRATIEDRVVGEKITTRLVCSQDVGALQKNLFNSPDEKQIVGRNSHYQFEIRREDPEKNRNWEIITVRELPQHGMSSSIVAKENRIFRRAERLLAEEGLSFLNTTTRELFADDTFEIVSARQKKLDDTVLVRLECKAHSTRKNLARFRSATLWLDPSKYWLLRKAVVQYAFEASQGHGQGEVVYTYSYRSAGEVPVIDKLTSSSVARDASGKVVAQGNNTYLYTIDLTKPEEEEFYLAHYGLPEPDATSESDP